MLARDWQTMLEISPEKVAHVIVKSREFDAKVDIWDEPASSAELDDSGEAILVFTQNDSDGRIKPYVHQKDAYNIRSYF